MKVLILDEFNAELDEQNMKNNKSHKTANMLEMSISFHMHWLNTQ